MNVAITGTIGSGKSYVSKLIHSRYGYELFNCDEIVKLAYLDSKVIANLKREFNTSNKDDIKKIINDENIKKLNSIIHPFVIDYIKKLTKDSKGKIILVEVPLLYETNMEIYFDKVILIHTNDKIRHERLKDRNKNDYNRMLQLEKYQLSSTIKLEKSDYVIYNNKDDVELINQIDLIIKDLKEGL